MYMKLCNHQSFHPHTTHVTSSIEVLFHVHKHNYCFFALCIPYISFISTINITLAIFVIFVFLESQWLKKTHLIIKNIESTSISPIASFVSKMPCIAYPNMGVLGLFNMDLSFILFFYSEYKWDCSFLFMGWWPAHFSFWMVWKN